MRSPIGMMRAARRQLDRYAWLEDDGERSTGVDWAAYGGGVTVFAVVWTLTSSWAFAVSLMLLTALAVRVVAR